MISLAEFEPVELGLPEDKFPQFRPAQIEAVEQILNNPKRFQALALPTGSGKSLIAMAAAKATGRRTAILTSTLGLMQQYERDFPNLKSDGAIRGKDNYECTGSKHADTTCRYGHLDNCQLANSCTYALRRSVAKRSSIVLTNYSYWIRANKFGQGLVLTEQEARRWETPNNFFELLVLDEAHEAMEELSRGLKLEIKQSWMKRLDIPFKTTDNIEYWSWFAKEHRGLIDAEYQQALLEYKLHDTAKNKDIAKELEKFLETVNELATITSAHWVCEMRMPSSLVNNPGAYGRNRIWEFSPIWPARWSESRLFMGIPKVLLMSATLRPSALKMLGITDKTDYEFTEWPRVFPAQKTPIYHIRNADSVRLTYKSSEDELAKWVETIDKIIDGRLDRKGLIHTVSYARQQHLLTNSRHAHLMMANTQDPESPNASQVIESFKAAESPKLLVSPSFSTGWDFPGTTCEYQIIAKVPFPDQRSKLMKARLEWSPTYGNYLTMQDLVQACGRGTRSETDSCEIFIVDSQISWFFYRNKALAPTWFKITDVASIPAAPDKLPE